MLKRFEVQGYRNFKDKFIIDFSDVREYQFNTQCIRNNVLSNAIIYGKNGVGKTNLGRAITEIKRNFMRNMRDDENFLNADTKLGYAQFNYIFQLGDDEIEYTFQKENRKIYKRESLYINQELIFDYCHDTKQKKTGNLKVIGAENLNWDLLDNQISVLVYIINSVPITSFKVLDDLYKFIGGMRLLKGNREYSSFDNMLETNLNEKEIKDLQKFLDNFEINEKIELKADPSGEKRIYSKHERKLIEFMKNASSGTLSLFFLFMQSRSLNNITFLFLDEFDAFYHYELAEKVIQLLQTWSHCQTIVTSHNTNLLSNKIMRPDCFFILTNEKITSIVNSTDRELREGHNLEKLYKSGEFNE